MWIVVNIGCIECGVSSDIVGRFSDKAEARRIADHLNNKAAWREGGQNYYEVFAEPVADKLNPEYSGYF